MKKLLIMVLIVLLLVLTGIAIIRGINIGSIEILGLNSIKEKSDALDSKIIEASKVAETDYKQALSTVEESTRKLKQEKSKYEEMTQVSTEGDVQNANQIERYEIETLWVKLGNHATSEGVTMKMDIKQGSSGATNAYNLQFTAYGTYISIVDFISDIENDSTLGFKIEDFKMIPVNTTTSSSRTKSTTDLSGLQATFVCKDVTIKDLESANTNNTNNTNNTDNTNNADNTNNNTTNNTNTTNNNNNTNNTNTTNNNNNTDNTNNGTNNNTNSNGNTTNTTNTTNSTR